MEAEYVPACYPSSGAAPADGIVKTIRLLCANMLAVCIPGPGGSFVAALPVLLIHLCWSFSSLQINAVRSIVPNKSNNEIVLVLQQFDNNIDRAVQAFMDGMYPLQRCPVFQKIAESQIAYCLCKAVILKCYEMGPPSKLVLLSRDCL